MSPSRAPRWTCAPSRYGPNPPLLLPNPAAAGNQGKLAVFRVNRKFSDFVASPFPHPPAPPPCARTPARLRPQPTARNPHPETRLPNPQWLRDRLRRSNPGCVVPPLPRRDRDRDEPGSEKLEARRFKLQLFLSRVAAHPLLASSPDVFTFLTEGDPQARKMGKQNPTWGGRHPRFWAAAAARPVPTKRARAAARPRTPPDV